MSTPHNTATVGNVLAGTAAIVSWTDIPTYLSVAASVMALVVGALTIWRMFKGS